MKSELPKVGDVFTVTYPFVLGVTQDADEDGIGERPTWNPGIRDVSSNDRGYAFGWADGVGAMELTVVGTLSVKGFPSRVCFTRKFTSPVGARFGKNRLHIVTADKFRRMSQRFAHNYQVAHQTPEQR